MFENLELQMFKKRITNKDMSKTIGAKTPKTFLNKKKGITEFTRRDMWLIQNKHFPELSIEYLFATNQNLKEKE